MKSITDLSSAQMIEISDHLVCTALRHVGVRLPLTALLSSHRMECALELVRSPIELCGDAEQCRLARREIRRAAKLPGTPHEALDALVQWTRQTEDIYAVLKSAITFFVETAACADESNRRSAREYADGCVETMLRSIDA